jgi:hypothetical protein
MERQDETQFTTKIDGFLEFQGKWKDRMKLSLPPKLMVFCVSRKMERQDETQFTTKIDGFDQTQFTTKIDGWMKLSLPPNLMVG